MPKILQVGYEDAVRAKLGVKESELPNSVINQRLIVDLAEIIIIKRVPDYASITDETDLLMLENAVVAYICYLLAPGMARRVNQEVTTIDVKWKKDKVDWSAKAHEFLVEVEQSLGNIVSVSVMMDDDILFGIAKAVVEE